MENFNFFALASRMKYIRRWGLMKNTETEDVKQHSFDTAMIAHALAVINNRVFGGDADADRAAVLAMYHDISEIYTGDLPTPVKYNSDEINSAYKNIEENAKEKLLKKLPDSMADVYGEIFREETSGSYLARLVKAADKISAYIKCIEEKCAGNSEFKRAEKSVLSAIKALDMPEAEYFIEKFIPAYYLTLDEI